MKPKVAFIVDALPGMGGGERVLNHAVELFPDAPIFTPFYNPSAFAGTSISQHPITSTFINRLPFAQTHYRSYLPLMMRAIRQLNLRQYELVISFSYAVAHAVQRHPGQMHLSYTHTPMRYAWRNYALCNGSGLRGWGMKWFLSYFRQWDSQAVAQVDHFAAVSKEVARLIQNVYQRDSQVIYPPVELERFRPHRPRDTFFITVSRLVAHKRIELIVRTFSEMKLPLLVVGEGPELTRLQHLASHNITFTGYQPDYVVADLLGRARAYVSAAEEDFGIAMVEAQAAGCPVISYGKGGALETVIDGSTGLFFDDQTQESLCDAVERFTREKDSFFENALIKNAQRFSVERFKEEFSKFASLACIP